MPLTRVYTPNRSYAPLLEHGALVTIFALGRGVNMDGSLTPEVKERVRVVLGKAVQLIAIGHTVRIIWTGGMSRKQASRDQHPAAREAQAMYDYAKTLPDFDKVADHKIEDSSTSTVENIVNSASHVLGSGPILVMSDTLHFMWDRVALIMRLCFPNRPIFQITVGRHVRGLKPQTKQIASMAVLVLMTLGVRPGDLDKIRARQERLNRAFMKRQLR